MSKRLQAKLRKRAIAWAGKMTRLAKALAPNHVKPAISSHVEAKEDGTFLIRTTADRSVAPDARAQEYGSGLRARRGPKQEYPIRPKNKKFLAFYENAHGEWDYELTDPPTPQVHLSDGRGLFFTVMHPGIKAANSGKGYIGPAQVQLRKDAKKELDEDIREAILADLRESFGRKSK